MFAVSPRPIDTGLESSEDTVEETSQDKGMDDEQQATAKPNLEPSPSPGDSNTSPKTADSADKTQVESVQDATMAAEGQSKGQSSPTITSPPAKPRHPSAESAETAFAKRMRDDYIVSIPLSLVRLSRRRSKSRSSSKDLGGKHVILGRFVPLFSMYHSCLHFPLRLLFH